MLFIDNDGGGFHGIFMDAAIKCNMISIHGPHRHINYSNDLMKVKKFGFYSCFKTVVTVHILQKPFDMRLYRDPYLSPYTENQDRRVVLGENSLLNNSLLPSPPTPMLFRVDDFTTNYQVETPDFQYSREIPLSPDQPSMPSVLATPQYPINSPVINRYINTPDTQLRHRKKIRYGCLPLKRWGNHLAAKVNNFKSRARSAFRKKVKKAHPIFRL